MLSIWNSQSTSIFFTSVNNLAALQKWRISNDLNLVLPAPPVPSSLTVWCFSQCLSSWSQRWHDSITYNTAMCPACQTAEKHLKIWPRYELEAQRTKSHNRNTDFFFFLFLKNGTIQASLATSEHMGISRATSFLPLIQPGHILPWAHPTAVGCSSSCSALPLWSHHCVKWCWLLSTQSYRALYYSPFFQSSKKKKKKVFRWPMRLDRIVRK